MVNIPIHKSLFSYLDIFGQNPHLYIQNSFRFQTNFGSLVTTIVALCTISAGIYFGREVWLKEKPLVNKVIEINNAPKNLTLDKDKWDMFFGLQYNNSLFINNSIYKIKLSMWEFKIDKGFSKSDILIEQCSSESFNSDNKKLFNLYNYKNAWCISPKNTKYPFLNLVWGQENFGYFEMSVWPCKNSTESNKSNSNITSTISMCSPREEIEKILLNGMFSIYSINNYFDSTNYKNPYSKAILNEFMPVSFKTFTQSIMWVYHSKVNSDVGFMFENTVINESFVMDNLKTNYYANADPDGRYIKFQFQLKNFKEKLVRKYMKLQEFSAQMGGLINFFFILGKALTFLLTEFKIREYLANVAFKFTIEKKSRIETEMNEIKIQVSGKDKNMINDNNIYSFKVGKIKPNYSNISSISNKSDSPKKGNEQNTEESIGTRVNYITPIYGLDEIYNNMRKQTQEIKLTFTNFEVLFYFCLTKSKKRTYLDKMYASIRKILSVENLINANYSVKLLRYLMITEAENEIFDKFIPPYTKCEGEICYENKYGNKLNNYLIC